MSSGRVPRRRRWPRAVAGIASVGLLACAAKAGTMYWFAESGASAYSDGQYDDSVTSFGRLETLNVIDPTLAHVGIGDARYRQGDLIGAEIAFARALDLDPGDCEIRFNLAVTMETQGDHLRFRQPLVPAELAPPFDPSAPRRDDPLERYTLALAVAAAEPCASESADDVGDRLADTRVRLALKIAALDDVAGDNLAPDPEAPENADRGDSEEIENLELRNQTGANQREQARDRDTTGAVPDGQSNW